MNQDQLHGLSRYTTRSGTRLGVQKPPGGATARVWAVLFDGLPMIEAGVPETLAAAQSCGDVPPLTTVYVESIEGAAKRGPTRCASLTTPATLDRFAGELDELVPAILRGEDVPAVLVGHSLGAIAAIHLASAGALAARQVALLSAALWWPGDDRQLSGAAAMDKLVAAPEVRVWLTAGAQEEPKLLRSNEVLASRLARAAHPFERRSHPGPHDVRPQDVADGIAWLCGTGSR
jgi:enterochelin esterase-like enzyme